MATSAVKSGPRPLSQAGADDPAPAAPKPKKTLLILGAALAVLAGGGAAAWHFLGAGHAPQAAHAQAPAHPPVFATLDPFTVNLLAESNEQYLQVGITLQLPDQSQADLVKQYMPVVRNRLVVLLSGKKVGELTTTAGKQALADDIVARLRQPFVPNTPAPKIDSVLFTSFVVQ